MSIQEPGFEYLQTERETKRQVHINMPNFIVNRGFGTAESFRPTLLTEVLSQSGSPLEEEYWVMIQGWVRTAARKDSRNKVDSRQYGENRTYDLVDLPPEVRDMLIGAEGLRKMFHGEEP
jgi:hypothetical protein